MSVSSATHRSVQIQAPRRAAASRRVGIIPRATNLFQEPGTPELMAGLAGSWFRHHLRSVPADDGGVHD
jgi:hypothetical protein